MLDLRRLRQDADASRANLARRLDAGLPAQMDGVLELDRRHREALARFEALRAERKAASEEVGRLRKAGQPVDALLARLKVSGDEEKALDAAAREAGDAVTRQLSLLPNFLLNEVPDGDVTANRVVRSWGAPPALRFSPRPHWRPVHGSRVRASRCFAGWGRASSADSPTSCSISTCGSTDTSRSPRRTS
jgi:seryl-tRNA synthetase